jgi:glycosyltransferase involved in cell wall biosynthesis/SAM-dependent methyltransferase
VKRDLVNVLCCPDCKGDLTLIDDTPEQAQVDSGGLVCRACVETFLIVRGVPRFVSSDQYARSFSYEWNRWNRVQLDVANGRAESEDAFLGKTAFTPAELQGKLVLDVGCGAGRFLDVASRWGANVIGIDLSFAVEASQKNLGHRPNVSVVQADVFRLPFREATFDAIFSLGVLHHSRDTRQAFLQLPKLLKEGGDLAVWLYCYEDRLYNAASDFWRAVLRPFGSRVVYAWCWLIVTLFSWLWARPGIWRWPWNVLPRTLPLSVHPDRQWRILDTFDWYSPRYQDKACSPQRVLGWCREAAIHDVRVLEFPTSVRGRRDTADVWPLLRRAVPELVESAIAPATPVVPQPGARQPSAAGRVPRRADKYERRVLVVRSCRPAQFARAVALARERRPDARIYGLTVAGHAETVLAGGVDEVLEVAGTTFNVFRLGLRTLARLRSLRFDEILIPQMTPHAGRHLNVYGVVTALSANQYRVVPGDEPSRSFTRRTFRTLLRQSFAEWCAYRWDTPMFVTAVAVMCAPSILRSLVGARPAVPPSAGRRRVLHVIGSLGMGGAQVQLAEVLNRTPADKYDVTLLVLDASDGSPLRRLITRDDVRVVFLPTPQNRYACLRQVADHCRTGHYDLVHTWMLGSNVVGTAAARLAGVPRVITSVRSMRKSHEWWYRQWWWRLLDGVVSWAADVVTVNGQALVADHAGWAYVAASRIEVVHNGLDPAAFVIDRAAARTRLHEEAALSRDAVVIGTVGRLAEEKGQAHFLRLLARARAFRPDIHGVIIGGGPSRASLEQLAERLGVSDAVTFLGERQDARALMAGFDVFVLPSVTEGFPNVLLEAAFLGIPALATDVGGNHEVLGNRSLLISPADAHAAARRLVELLSDETAMADAADNVRQRALDMFTATRSVARWMSLYDRCFDQQPGRIALEPVGAMGDR